MALIYKKEGRVATFTINRPEAFNAMNSETYKELSDALIDFKDDDNLWVGIVTGAGDRAFCAGADIKTMLPAIKLTKDQPWVDPPSLYRGLNLWKPVIAAVNGLALGGGLELALGCDIKIASENAVFGLPEVTLGLIPGWGGTQRLPRAIPVALAAEMILTGKKIDAKEAYRIGLVSKVVSLADLMKTSMETAEALLKAGPLAVRAAKKAMMLGLGEPLQRGLEIERDMIDYITHTEDFTEGTTAFVEKRKPEFKAK
ncbi:MAG TPA: enoyl-CoA hydratase [Dehalococcoidia bacterium]|nr:enoyl-CoA hydratase [Dehalococcoidia bacterium]